MEFRQEESDGEYAVATRRGEHALATRYGEEMRRTCPGDKVWQKRGAKTCDERRGSW
ncbi:hypothetical protein JZ785_13950 [Alicyclobacillus curvatus]|nr:hypothetical protein JZ785_13950 [Alicyclobacillus curvatus]